jgi:valyl-tRNA synthetase
VYLHGTVRDTQHRKMSKSLGNGIDPLDVIARYGADALRYTLVGGLGLGADVIVEPDNLEESLAPGRNFVTKLWNIGRFIVAAVGSDPVEPGPDFADQPLTRADQWILSRLDHAIVASNAALGPPRPPSDGRWPPEERGAGLRLSEYAEAARGLVWNDLADWYVEHCKRRLAPDAPAADRGVARAVLVHVFDDALRLLHPIVPFVTEALWDRLPVRGAATSELLCAAWPTVRGIARYARAAAEYDVARAVVSAVRQIRADYRIAPGERIDVRLEPVAAARTALAEEADAIGALARCTIHLGRPTDGGAAAVAVLADGSTVVVPLAGHIDVAKECRRLRDELAQTERQLATVRQRLATPAFAERAKPEVVAGAREQEHKLTGRATQLRSRVEALCGR